MPATQAPPRPFAGMLSACLHLFALSLRRQVFSRQTLVSLLVSALSLLIVVVWSIERQPSVKKFAQEILLPVDVAFLLPIFAICYGASSIGGEREDRTLVYLLITPLPRPIIYLTKYLASLTLVIGWSAGTLVGLGRLGGSSGHEAVRLFWPAVLWGTIAYGTLFHALGAAFRRGTILSLAYTFLLEWILGNMPGIVKRVSVSFYVSCMIYDSGAEYDITSLVGRDMFLPISGQAAMIVLGLASGAMFVVGLAAFSAREYRDLS